MGPRGGRQRSWPGSSRSIRLHPEPPTYCLSPSSLISSYFRTATWRLQAFWMVRAKPSNLRSRISSRRKSWARERGGGSWHLPKATVSGFLLAHPTHMLLLTGTCTHTVTLQSKFLPPNDRTQGFLPVCDTGPASIITVDCLAGFESQLCLLLALQSCQKWKHHCFSHLIKL